MTKPNKIDNTSRKTFKDNLYILIDYYGWKY